MNFIMKNICVKAIFRRKQYSGDTYHSVEFLSYYYPIYKTIEISHYVYYSCNNSYNFLPILFYLSEYE